MPSSRKTTHKAVTLSVEFYDWLQRAHVREFEHKPTKESLSDWTERLLFDQIERDKDLRSVAPYLEEETIEGNVITIRDNRRRVAKSVDVRVVNGAFWCDEDETDNCVHIGFAWSIPRVYSVMTKYGKRPKT